jgi:myo-inositol-1(or 4)-monophosphatase
MIRENPILKGHGILAEESGAKKAESAFLWVIDPIDGTQNFRNGMSDFGISIGGSKECSNDRDYSYTSSRSDIGSKKRRGRKTFRNGW